MWAGKASCAQRVKAWATVVLTVYPLLVVLAAACPVGLPVNADHHADAPHHSSTHTSLCDWLCQLSSDPPFVSLFDHTMPGVVFIAIPTLLTQHLLTGGKRLPGVRGPPAPLQV